MALPATAWEWAQELEAVTASVQAAQGSAAATAWAPMAQESAARKVSMAQGSQAAMALAQMAMAGASQVQVGLVLPAMASPVQAEKVEVAKAGERTATGLLVPLVAPAEERKMEAARMVSLAPPE